VRRLAVDFAPDAVRDPPRNDMSILSPRVVGIDSTWLDSSQLI
jgi:hypothetical protein